MMLLPMVLKQLYPDPDPLDEPDEKDDEAEREPIEEWSVTMAVVGDGGVADIPRPNGDGWLAYGHRVEPGSVTMLWRRERDAKCPGRRGAQRGASRSTRASSKRSGASLAKPPGHRRRRTGRRRGTGCGRRAPPGDARRRSGQPYRPCWRSTRW